MWAATGEAHRLTAASAVSLEPSVEIDPDQEFWQGLCVACESAEKPCGAEQVLRGEAVRAREGVRLRTTPPCASQEAFASMAENADFSNGDDVPCDILRSGISRLLCTGQR